MDITLTLIIIHKIMQAITKVEVYAVEEHHIGLIHIDLYTRDTAVRDRIMDQETLKIRQNFRSLHYIYTTNHHQLIL